MASHDFIISWFAHGCAGHWRHFSHHGVDALVIGCIELSAEVTYYGRHGGQIGLGVFSYAASVFSYAPGWWVFGFMLVVISVMRKCLVF